MTNEQIDQIREAAHKYADTNFAANAAIVPLCKAFASGATWMQEQDQWISVIEGLPEPQKRVEIFISNQYTTDHIAVGFVNNGKQWHALYNTPSEAGVYPVQYVTHWREIIGPK